MRVDPRILVLIPVLLGLGCRPNPFFVAATEADSSSTWGTDTVQDDCGEVTVNIEVEDAFFVTSSEVSKCFTLEGMAPCASRNFGVTTGLRLYHNDSVTSAYVIRPVDPLSDLISDPDRVTDAKLRLLFYRDDEPGVTDSADFILAKIAKENVWVEGSMDGQPPVAGGSTYESLSMESSWFGGNGPIGGSVPICDVSTVSIAQIGSFAESFLCPETITNAVKEWVANNDRSGLVLYLKEAESGVSGKGYSVKSTDHLEEDYRPVLSVTYCTL